MARIFIVDQREFPDPDPNLTVEEVRDMMASFYPELANATYTERQREEDTLYEFQRRVGTKGDYNITCPFCREQALRATVETRDNNVPLRVDGYDPVEGFPESTEIREIVCGGCGHSVQPHHYLEHGADGDPCDCADAKEETGSASGGPLFDDTYTGDRWRYGLTYRPVGVAQVPQGWIISSNRDHPDFAHGTVDYPRELTPDEVAAYQLSPLGKV